MKAQQLMSSPVLTCRVEEDLTVAAKIMWDHDCGSVPVLDHEERIVGIVTDRDICMAAYTQGKPLLEIPVTLAMSHNVRCCGPEDSIADIEELMKTRKIRRVPVVDAEKHVIGIISLNDLATEGAGQPARKRRSISDSEIAETLAEICQHRGMHAMAGSA